MANNKAVGTDCLHVEMPKPNARKTAELLTAIWFVVAKYNKVLDYWLERITVPLFKGNGRQLDPSYYCPLTILPHPAKSQKRQSCSNSTKTETQT